MWISLRSKIILSNEYHQISMPIRSEFPTVAEPITTFYKLQVIPGKCTSLPNIILLLDWTSKRYITSNKYCFLTSHVVIPEYIVNCQDVTDDKGKITTIMDMKAFTSIYHEESNYAFASFFRRHIKNVGSITAKTTKCILIEKYIYTIIKREIKWWKMKDKHPTAVQLLQKFTEYFRIQSHLSTVWASGCPCQAKEHNIIQRENSCKAREKRVTRNDMWKCKEQISYPTYTKLAKMKYNLQHISARNLRNSEFFIIIPPYYYFTENEENSRASSFEEGAPDVGHTVAQEIIFYYYGPVLIRGPLNAYLAKGASLGSDTFVRKSPWDQKYL